MTKSDLLQKAEEVVGPFQYMVSVDDNNNINIDLRFTFGGKKLLRKLRERIAESAGIDPHSIQFINLFPGSSFDDEDEEEAE